MSDERDELFQLMLGRTTTKAVERILAAGYRKPQQVTTIEELDALPAASVILAESSGDSYQKARDDGWFMWGGGGFDSNEVELPATVLHVGATQ